MFHPEGPTFWELARQALSSTQRGYDLLAPKFDVTPFRTPDFVLDRVADVLSEEGSFEEILDVCCGTGAAMAALLPLCKRRMTGIDFSQGMLDVAKQNVRSENKGLEIEFIQGDVMKMEFESRFDLVVSFGAFGHILPQDESDFVFRIARALKVGGKFAFVTSELPSKLGATYWLARSFNGAMHVRNFFVRPKFVMFYLTFLWPNVGLLLRECGLKVRVDSLFPDQPRYRNIKLVIAEKL